MRQPWPVNSVTFNNNLRGRYCDPRSGSTNFARRPSGRASATSSRYLTPNVLRRGRPTLSLATSTTWLTRMLARVFCLTAAPSSSKWFITVPEPWKSSCAIRPAPGRPHPGWLGRHHARRLSAPSTTPRNTGAKIASLLGRKINNAENQLAFVHFFPRLIVEGQVAPVDAVKAYHAVLGRTWPQAASPARGRSRTASNGDELRRRFDSNRKTGWEEGVRSRRLQENDAELNALPTISPA